MKKWIFIFAAILLYFQNFNYLDLSEYQSETIHVEIKGAVHKEGSYELAYNSSLQQLLEEAGGVNEKGDTSSLNLNQVLHDKDVIVIPDKNEKKKISINSASMEELMTLKGVGPSMAQKIIDYRETQGSFQKLEDLMNIKGIKEKMFMKIKDQICL